MWLGSCVVAFPSGFLSHPRRRHRKLSSKFYIRCRCMLSGIIYVQLSNIPLSLTAFVLVSWMVVWSMPALRR